MPYLLDAATFPAQVNNSMAVGAHWPHIGNRVHFVLCANLRQGLDVVNVDESVGDRPIHCAELEATHRTGRPIVSNAAGASNWVTLVGVDDDPADRSLEHAA